MTTSKAAPIDPRQAAEPIAQAAATASASQSAMIEQAMMLPQEVTRFCAHRMSRDLETMQAIGRCRTPAELVNVWTEAAQTAAEDYRDEMTRMMEIVTNGAAKAVSAGSRAKKR